jgi:ribulose-5-phosphate 4-epimerase/fuculose-1-phosphate aldolase
MNSADILQLDCAGIVLSGNDTAERTAFVIHSGVHKQCPDARAILDTHIPCTTDIACTTGRFEPIRQNALRFQRRTRVSQTRSMREPGWPMRLVSIRSF